MADTSCNGEAGLVAFACASGLALLGILFLLRDRPLPGWRGVTAANRSAARGAATPAVTGEITLGGAIFGSRAVGVSRLATRGFVIDLTLTGVASRRALTTGGAAFGDKAGNSTAATDGF